MKNKKSRRAVLYARVSGDDSKTDGGNIQGQLDMCRDYATGKAYEIIAEIAEDEAKKTSGASWDLDGLNQVLEMAEASAFDVLIVREMDRLSRSLAKQLIVEETLARQDVAIEYVLASYEDTPEGRLSKHIRATVAEYEREKIRERMIRGRRRAVKAGNVMVFGRAPYGYEIIEDQGLKILAIVEDDAKVIRMIFEWYTAPGERTSLRAIAKRLNDLGIPPSAEKYPKLYSKNRTGVWASNMVGHILRNEVYIGVWRYAKTGIVNGKRMKKRGAERESLDVVNVPPIIDNTLWKMAQDRLEENKTVLAGKRRYTKHYLLSGHVRCSVCGRACVGRSAGQKRSDASLYTYYRCYGGLDDTNERCNVPYFNTDKVNDTVWQWVKSILTDEKRLTARLTEYQQSIDNVNKPIEAKIDVLDGLIADSQRKLEQAALGFKELAASASRAKAILLADIERLESDLDAHEARRAALVKKLVKPVQDEIIDDVKEFAALLGRNLSLIDDNFEERRWFIERLNVQTELGVEDQNQVANVSCELGGQSLVIPSKTISRSHRLISSSRV